MMVKNTQDYMRINRIATISGTILIAAAITTAPVLAAEPPLTSEQSRKISESCSTIRQNLKTLQRSDSRTRTYFGSIYETVASKYLKPLNLRLVNNDMVDSSLLGIQTSFATNRSNFSDDFIQYSKSLEELITIDCYNEPDSFYRKLIETRDKRAAVADDVNKLNKLLTNIAESAKKLKGTLK